MFNIQKSRNSTGKRRHVKTIMVDGKPIPLYHDHPPFMDVKSFITKLECNKLLVENPWIVNIKMYENYNLIHEEVRTDHTQQTIELSRDFLELPLSNQRDTFIRVVCHFLAVRYFRDCGEGKPYELLVERYTAKDMSNTMPIIEPKKRKS